MLSIQTDKKLSILLPNTNKALAKVLKDATLSELKSITQDKDLKSILNSLLKDSSLNSSADKALLTLVKNNPTLKELAKIQEPIKELLTTLKSDKNLQNIAKDIQKFIPPIQDIKQENIKLTITNSGIFLESKLKNIQAPTQQLKSVLEDLKSLLQKSEIPKTVLIQNKIEDLLKTPILKDTPIQAILQKEPQKLLENLSKNIQTIIKNIQAEIKNLNPITEQNFTKKLEKLENLLQIKTPISESVKQNQESVTIKDSVILKELNVKEQVTKEFKIPSIMESIKDLNITLRLSFTNSSKSFLNELSKILNILQSIEQTAITPKIAIEKIFENNIPHKLQTIITDIKTEIKNADTIFSKEVRNVLKELNLLNSPQKLSSQESIKELLSNDLKAVLSKVSQEINKLSPNPSNNDALKQIDKLNLAIDYYQLVSHLSNSSSLYIPISWDYMKEGEISIKKTKDDKFYCDIELQLQEYNELRIRLSIFDKNQLNIYISSDSSKLKRIMGENMSELRSALIDLKINPRDIRFSNYTKNTKNSEYDMAEKNLDIGFEVKG